MKRRQLPPDRVRLHERTGECALVLACALHLLFLCSGDLAHAQTAAADAGAADAELVRILQIRLNAEGFEAGPQDGVLGDLTQAGLRALQRSLGLAETGELDEAVLGRLSARTLRLRDFETFRDCQDCPEMVMLPAGTFRRGSLPEEPGHEPDEAPVETLSVDRFAIGKTAITFRDWRLCVMDGGCSGHPEPDDAGWGRGTRPVIDVSWHDAQTYIDWINARLGADLYRLPTEAEWEYAAGAGSDETPTPDALPGPGKANFGAVDCCAAQTADADVWLGAAPSAQFDPNAFGLFDMAGNVWEWTLDCWRETYAMPEPDGACQRRVRRGGSWYYPPLAARPANRGWQQADFRDNENGFRVVRIAPPQGAPEGDRE